MYITVDTKNTILFSKDIRSMTMLSDVYKKPLCLVLQYDTYTVELDYDDVNVMREEYKLISNWIEEES